MVGLCAVSFGAGALARRALADPCRRGRRVVSWHHRRFAERMQLIIARLKVSPLKSSRSERTHCFEALRGGVSRVAPTYIITLAFPPVSCFWDKGYLGGIVPTQTVCLVVAVVAYFALQHCTVVGRALRAVGYSGEGARYAAIPVARRLLLVYALSGFAASVAAIVYVAHLGQAKSDAGNGYELTAITAAVVLGGTSIFGGSGTIPGSLLGITAIVVLQNGLRLAALPAELAGILTGVLLVVTIATGAFCPAAPVALRLPVSPASIRKVVMKNSQLAILCATVLAGAVIVSLSNWYLVKLLRPAQRGRVGRRSFPTTLRRRAFHGRRDAQGQGRALLHQLPSGR